VPFGAASGYTTTSGTGWVTIPFGTSTTMTLTSSNSTSAYYEPAIWSIADGTINADYLNPWVPTYYVPVETAPPVERTDEERAEMAVQAEARRVAREAARAVQAAEEERRRQAQASVVDRATALLLSVLDETQAAQYQADRTFEVIGSHGGLYRIRPGIMANVDALHPETREFIGRLCAHPRERDANGYLPDQDLALGQLLDLTSDEPGFCRTANVHGGRRPEVAALAA
jgi:hypothetical protein